MDEFKHISAEDFASLPAGAGTILDLREPDEVLLGSIPGAVNIPFSRIWKELDSLTRDKPVYVLCRSGELSEEISEVLADRGFDAYNVDGGYLGWKTAAESVEPFDLDARGLRCPGPIVQTAARMKELVPGQKLRIEATEEAFTSDIAVWCRRTGNALLSLERRGDIIEAVIEKRERAESPEEHAREDKTFILFSGDLDKTIAAFIMANGAAAMGRKVTMFFTFWGLNILRRPKKVPVAKSLIERAFGAMMPRGTAKLGLSRMNMGGMGAKLIRRMMKSKGIASLEELIDQARAQGVRMVACQMSMDIMGIRQEELIDGVELGGVATFLGSGEESDMSLFI